MPFLFRTHTKKPWYVTWACDMEVTNSNYHYTAGSCRGWAGRASHQRLLMPMVLQVLYRVMPRVRALWVVLLRLHGGVASDAVGGEGAVSDALAVAAGQVALLVVLFLRPVVRALHVMLRFTVSLLMMMMRVLHVVVVLVRVWAVFGLCLRAGCLCSRLGPWWVAVLAGPVGGSDGEGAL